MQTYSPKKYLIQTFGCQANTADSNTMAGVLEALGFESTKAFNQANILVVNTCSVRQKSEDKVYGIGKKVKQRLEKQGDKPFIVMAGCMVGSVTGKRQRYSFEELKNRTPWVDVYINPGQIMELPNILAKEEILDEWALKKVKKFRAAQVKAVQPEKKHAFVNISQGCDNFCTFCVVPYARGEEVSRNKASILSEIEHLANNGFSEVTLCGQNVNSWGLSRAAKFKLRSGSDQKLPFAELLREVHKIEGIEKIEFISSNPFDFTEDLINAMNLPKISNYLHFAVQSGNNDVLQRMNRRHTIQDFLGLVDRIKKVKPDIEFGTDVIVGFPGETREQFMDTVKLFQTVSFAVAYISIYSSRKGTQAEKYLKDDVPLKEKKWRHAYLTKVWKATKSA